MYYPAQFVFVHTWALSLIKSRLTNVLAWRIPHHIHVWKIHTCYMHKCVHNSNQCGLFYKQKTSMACVCQSCCACYAELLSSFAPIQPNHPSNLLSFHIQAFWKRVQA